VTILVLKKLKEYLSIKPGSTEDYPFGPDTTVFKVGGKMFALFGEDDNPIRMNLKCDPDEALILRDMFESVIPGYHMNKEHWNTIILDGSIPESEILKMIDESYRLVFKSLKKTEKARLKNNL
jgi:predicted DNA-binding protein (MmcQ/YjbR family)